MGSVALVECTIYDNEAPRGAGISADIPELVSCNFTIIAGNRGSEGFYVPPGTDITLACCDIYGNEGGDWVGGIAQFLGINCNISEDPMFCDPENDDFTLDCSSPCAPGNNPPCGPIGAWPVGCGPSPAVTTTWGALKSLFSR